MHYLLLIFILLAYSVNTYADDIFSTELAENKAQIKNPFANQQKLTTIYLKIKYADISQLIKIIQDKTSGLLSKRGTIIADTRTSTLKITDINTKLIRIKQFIHRIDVPLPQILIKARIVNIDEDFTQELGIKFGSSTENYIKDNSGLNIDLPTTATGHLQLAIANLGHNNLLNLELAALASEGHSKIIAEPKLLTINAKPAVIETGEEIPYQEKTTQDSTATAFKKAVLSLKITPSLIDNNKISLKISVNQDNVSTITVQGVPAIQTRHLQTQVIANNKATIVLGGVFIQNNHNVTTKIPFISKIPVLGKLFSNKQAETSNKELLIFITPEIIMDSPLQSH